MPNAIISQKLSDQIDVSSSFGDGSSLFRAERTPEAVAVSGYTTVGDAGGDLPSASPNKLGGEGCLVIDQRSISQAWGEMIEGIGNDLGGWDWFCTLTFRDPGELQRQQSPTWTKPGWGYAHKGHREFTKGLMGERFGKSQPYWISCMEMQKSRGVPHWHMLMGGLGDERRMDWVDWWHERYGIARILPYDAELGARYYLGKYLTKDVADILYSPQCRANHRVVARSRQVTS